AVGARVSQGYAAGNRREASIGIERDSRLEVCCAHRAAIRVAVGLRHRRVEEVEATRSDGHVRGVVDVGEDVVAHQGHLIDDSAAAADVCEGVVQYLLGTADDGESGGDRVKNVPRDDAPAHL